MRVVIKLKNISKTTKLTIANASSNNKLKNEFSSKEKKMAAKNDSLYVRLLDIDSE